MTEHRLLPEIEPRVGDRRQPGAGEADLPGVSTGPLWVREDENGDLFLSSAEVCEESLRR